MSGPVTCYLRKDVMNWLEEESIVNGGSVSKEVQSLVYDAFEKHKEKELKEKGKKNE